MIGETVDRKEVLKQAFVKALPITGSYLFVSMAYGLTMQEAGLSWFWSLFTSLTVYTGAFQFVLVTFLSSGASILTIALTALFMNSRQFFYGLTFVEDFKKIGYVMIPKLLYAPDYGIPKMRKRVFFVGLRDGKTKFEFPEPVVDKEHYVTCEEAIGDLPSLQTEKGEIIYGEEIQDYTMKPANSYQRKMRSNSGKVLNHIGSIPIEKTRKMISLVPEGKNYKALPEEYQGIYKYHEALTRYHSKKPSNTINTGHRSHFHYKWNRIPTVRESARLQSFPDDFIFYGNKSQQYRQVGNAVPPMLGQVVAEKLKQYLKGQDDVE